LNLSLFQNCPPLLTVLLLTPPVPHARVLPRPTQATSSAIYVFLLSRLYILIVCLCIFIVPAGTLQLP